MAVISQIRSLFLGNRQFRVQIVGGDSAGKSSFLYTLKNNGKPCSEHGSATFLPFDHERIKYPLGWEFEIFTIGGGCSPFSHRNGEFHFITPETLVWLVHDCSSKESIHVRETINAMRDRGAKYLWVVMSKQDMLPPDERARIVSEHRAMLEDILKQADEAGIKWFLVDTPGFNLKSGNFVRPFLKDVSETVATLIPEDGKAQNKAVDSSSLVFPPEAELRATIESLQMRDIDDFWKAFLTAKVTSWNHVDHLQAGYVVLLKSIEKEHGLLKCTSTFLEHLERRRKTQPEIFRNNAHFTLTAFWIIQLRMAAFAFQHDHNSGIAPTRQDFRAVLLGTPSLMNTRLWMKHYTKNVLFTQDARTNFVMPDIEPFPQVKKTITTEAPSLDRDVESKEDLLS